MYWADFEQLVGGKRCVGGSKTPQEGSGEPAPAQVYVKNFGRIEGVAPDEISAVVSW